jgi:iron-sulfur cluster assembly accessory protein
MLAEATITVTPRAADKVLDLAEAERAILRLAVQGGGCGGFMYGLTLEEQPQEDDLSFATPRDEVTLVVDPLSLPFLQGATVDFLDGLQESGFKVENPNATSSCGCGSSFRVDEDDCPSTSEAYS